MRHYLVPTDFNAPAKAALDFAIELCKESGGQITLLHVFHLDKVTEFLMGLDAMEHISYSLKPGTSSERSLNAEAIKVVARQRLSAMLDANANAAVPIQPKLLEGRPAIKIVEFAQENDIDMIVMGTQGRDGFTDLFLGSVAENVVRTARCPVLTIPAGTKIAYEPSVRQD